MNSYQKIVSIMRFRELFSQMDIFTIGRLMSEKFQMEAPQTWIDPPTIIEYECLASVLQPYPTVMGHFSHEALPRLLYLLQHIPDSCPIVILVSPFVQRYIVLLSPHYQSRIVNWKGAGHV